MTDTSILGAIGNTPVLELTAYARQIRESLVQSL